MVRYEFRAVFQFFKSTSADATSGVSLDLSSAISEKTLSELAEVAGTQRIFFATMESNLK